MKKIYYNEIRIRFRAGHRLIKDYNGHCVNVHGEGYTAILCCKATKLDSAGMVEDFSKLKKLAKMWIDNNLDHSYIYYGSDVVGKELERCNFRVYKMRTNPTAECLAELLYTKLCKDIPSLYKVGIIESFDDSIAWFEVVK